MSEPPPKRVRREEHPVLHSEVSMTATNHSDPTSTSIRPRQLATVDDQKRRSLAAVLQCAINIAELSETDCPY